MSYTSLNGRGISFPSIGPFASPPAFVSNAEAIDATGEKICWAGPIWWPGSDATKNISRVQFLFGSGIAKAGGSALTCSHQGVSSTTGAPLQPDGSVGGSVAIPNADLVSGAWYRTGTFSATRTVAKGDNVAIVLEYDGSGRLGSDSVTISSVTVSGSLFGLNWGVSLFTASWTNQSRVPVLVFEFDDGTYGIIDGGVPYSAINTHTFNANSATADEYACVINLPVDFKVDGLWSLLFPSSNASDHEILLYSGTTALATVSMDANRITATGSRTLRVPITEQSLTANTDYYVAVRPTTNNNVTVYSFDVADTAFWNLIEGGTAIQFATRLNQGSWAAKTASRRLHAGVVISALQSGGAGGIAALTGGGLAR